MWIGDVAMNTWMRGCVGVAHRLPRAVDVLERRCATAPRWSSPGPPWRSPRPPRSRPGWRSGSPASITSTPRRASCSAISSFSPTSSEIPGDCSPSRRVVSKIFTWSVMAVSLSRGVVSVIGRRAFRATKNLPGREGTRRRPRAPEGARSYVRRRLWVRSSFVMNRPVLPDGAPRLQSHVERRGGVRECADAQDGAAHPRARHARRRGYAVWRAFDARRSTPGVTGSRSRSPSRPQPHAAAPDAAPPSRRPSEPRGSSRRRRRVPGDAPGEGQARERHLPRARRRQLRPHAGPTAATASPDAAEADGLRAAKADVQRQSTASRARCALGVDDAVGGAELRDDLGRAPASTSTAP